MATGAKFVHLDGQYASGVLGQFRIIRGFATLQDLSRISTPYFMSLPHEGTQPAQGFQRQIDPTHAAAVKQYLERGRPRFIPEIILSIRSSYVPEKGKLAEEIGVSSETTPGLWVKRRWKSQNISTHRITVELARIPELHEAMHIRRIDGNQRLWLANELAPQDTEPTRYLAPFCAILLGPPDDENDNFVEAMIFHVINSKARHLDSEHALDLVLRQRFDYRLSPEDEFRSDAGLHLTRLLKDNIAALPAVQRERLGTTPSTVLNSAANAMVAQTASLSEARQAIVTFADDLSGAITDILARLPSTHPALCKAEFFIELASLAWGETDSSKDRQYRIDQAVATLQALGRWLDHDGLHNIQGKRSIAQQLFEIFRSVRLRVPRRVFLSRWYPVDADGKEKSKADNRLAMIKRTLDDLRREGIDLALDDPGTEEGGTFGIHQAMYDALGRNDIILVDLSGVRPNVCIEAGYALKHLEGGRLIFLFQPTEATENNKQKWDRPPFDLTTFRYDSITDTGEIPAKLTPHLKAIYQRALEGM